MMPGPLADQAAAALAVLRDVLGDAIAAVWVYGSATDADGPRPDSDLDLFVLAERHVSPAERRAIVEGLTPISWRRERPDGWRPLEVTIVASDEVRPWRYPPRMELQFGEWLRESYQQGDYEPEERTNPDLAVIMRMVRERGEPLVGPEPGAALETVPHGDLVRATLDALPALLADLEDDTRNVLLTLARMWCTLATGELRTKDAAARWAAQRAPAAGRSLLERAVRLYLDGGWGSWDADRAAVLELAGWLAGRIREAAVRTA